MKITLHPASLKGKDKTRDAFYTEELLGNCMLGHQHGETGDLHEVRISKEFYDQFVAERIKAEYDKITKS